MSKAPNLDGFREWLDKAIRADDDVDWSTHTVDYQRFKQRLKFFARRREQIRNMVRSSSDGKLSEQVLIDLLGPKTSFPARKIQGVNAEMYSNAPLSHNLSMDPHSHIGMGPPDVVGIPTTRYVEMNESGHVGLSRSSEDASKSSGEGLNPKKSRRTQRGIMRRLSVSERNEIIVFLDWEMDKVLMFYLSQWQKLSHRLEHRQKQQQLQDGSTQQLIDYPNIAYATGCQDWLDTDLGDEILELIAFCVINVVTTQQILVRYDTFALACEGTPMLNYYMKKVTKHPTSFRKILFHEEVQAIASSFVAGSADSPFVSHFNAQRTMFNEILESLQSTQSLSSRDDVPPMDAFVNVVRKLFLVGLFEDRLGLEPAYLTARGKSLTSEVERLAHWRRRKFDISASREKPKGKILSGVQVFHLTLNMVAAFLYCMNYYIVEPSSTMYVNRLGAHDAMSGTLIGMMPLAAFISSIPYSMWTNHSFRQPFMMSCFMLILGNLLYSLADRVGVVSVALIGRFVSGLGAPKCIIRRYMADTTPVSLRTGVNAGFGMVVAAGSAMGPAMAIVLNKIDYAVYVRPFGLLKLNGLTLPGYFMAGLWLTFGIIVVCTFEEPAREGLQEQKEMEMRSAISHTPSNIAENPQTNDDLNSVFSGESSVIQENVNRSLAKSSLPDWIIRIGQFFDLITLPVRICLGLLFCKVFTIESLVSATSALTKNRYKWQLQQVGLLGLSNGLLVIPFSILIGRLSMSYQDHVLMKWLVSIGCFGMFLLVDLSDLVATPTPSYNKGHVLAVSPERYMIGYFLSYISIQAFEGVIGSTLSKVIPTTLASGTFNSGLLATLVDTFGRSCGDLYISAAGFISLRQLMNLLFIPGFIIMLTCLIVIERCRDLLSV